MNLERYSSSYVKTEDNFVIISDKSPTKDENFRESSLYGALCVVRNIIQRGNSNFDKSKNKPQQHPTKLSNYLSSVIGTADISREVCFISEKINEWDKTIKGDDNNLNYPARFFYDKLLPYALGKEFAFAKNLMLPEADFEEIVGEGTAFRGQSVDFYLPQAHMAIEIDGAGHRDPAQINKDKERENELRRHGIHTVRIKTSDIRNNGGDLEYDLRRVGRMIASSGAVRKYKQFLGTKLDESIEQLETIMRVQIMILSLLMKGELKLNTDAWHFFIDNSDVNGIERLIEIAYQDLQFWIKAVSGLNKIDVSFPQIIFAEERSKSDIALDYSLYQRYDDNCIPADNLIYIRTDYYTGKNHFKVAVSKPLKYQLNLRENKEDRLNLMFLLQNIFGFSGFRDGQEQIIENTLNGHDTVGILPTGTGKSICYQLPAFLQPGVTIIIDPIISLMMDQKRTLEINHNISQNNYIASNQIGRVKGKIIEDFRNGKYQMLWISPERFQSEVFREGLHEINESLNFCLAVIDEVHCLSEWGHDFRIPYLTLIKTLRQFCPKAVFLGLTATASEFVLQDIRAEFGKAGKPLEDKSVIASYSMDREELKYIRIPVKGDEERNATIKSIIESETRRKSKNIGQGLLFCKTISPSASNQASCFNMKTLLEQPKDNGLPIISESRLFYGKMEDSKKRENQESFMNGEFPLMICTKAFGMGIDNPNIRYTIHNSLPSSVESFYQEAGRAGRDRQSANCYILYHVDAYSRNVVEASENLLDILNYGPLLDGCDLGTTIFFYNTNHDDEETETEAISDTLKLVMQSPVIQFDNADKKKKAIKQKIEQALYKLSILGIVKDWTVNYKSLIKGDCIVTVAANDEITYKSSLEAFIKYVKQYDAEFDIEKEEAYEDLYYKDKKEIVNVIRMLVRWTNNNIVYNRVQCSKTMMDWCSEKVSDELFREHLEAYFRIGEETASLKHIANNPRDWREWFKVFFKYDPIKKKKKNDLVDHETIRENHATLQRFLESYQNNTGLNYLDGMFQILYKENIEDHELIRMNRSIDTIEQMEDDDQAGIVRSTLEIASAINNKGTLVALSQLIINRFPRFSRMVYDYLHDDYSLMIELEKGVKRMEAIQWTI